VWFHVQPGGSAGQKPVGSATDWIGYSQSVPLEGPTSPPGGGLNVSMKSFSVSVVPTTSSTSLNDHAFGPRSRVEPVSSHWPIGLRTCVPPGWLPGKLSNTSASANRMRFARRAMRPVEASTSVS
jgi:hypothetical protein